MASYELCGAAQLAPRWNGPTTADTTTNVQTPLENAVPLLVIQGALDEDVIGQGLASFDAMGAEDLATALEPGVCGDDRRYLPGRVAVHDDRQ